MNEKDIITRKFEKATFNGYKTDDVDDFLREVSNEYAQLQKDKSELERKLEVLADKIREYRDDEDALKDALLLAQKQGNAIVSESRASADKLRKETNETVTKQLADAKEKSEKMVKDADDYAKRMTKDSNERADKLVKDARAKAEEIKTAMNRQQEIQEQILQQTRREVTEYRSRIMARLKEHMEFLEALPERIENDFVKKTAAEVEKREAERAKEERAREAELAAKQAERVKAAAKQQAAQKNAAAKQEKSNEKTEKPDDEPFKAEDKEAGKTAEMPFCNSNAESKQRRNDLQFGKNKS